jgi:tetratricopeptide (TPR) repeat protein
VLKAMGRLNEALISLDRAIASKNTFAEAHYSRGLVLEALNRPTEANQAFHYAAALNPKLAGKTKR